MWGYDEDEEGEAWVLLKALFNKKKKKKRRAFISFILIFISIGPFFIRDISQVFFLPLRSIFPVNISLFVCFCVFLFCVSYIALRVTGGDGQDGRPSINSLCHTGNAGGGTGRGRRRLGRAVRGEAGL